MVFKSHKIIQSVVKFIPPKSDNCYSAGQDVAQFDAGSLHSTQKLSYGPYPEPGESRLTFLLVPTPPTSMFLKWSLPLTFTDFNFARIYVGYSESKYRLRISLKHPRDCHFAHVQWLPLSIEKPQTPFREIRVMFMFVPVH